MPTFGIANTWQANNWQYQKLPTIGNFLRGWQVNMVANQALANIWHFPNVGMPIFDIKQSCFYI